MPAGWLSVGAYEFPPRPRPRRLPHHVTLLLRRTPRRRRHRPGPVRCHRNRRDPCAGRCLRQAALHAGLFLPQGRYARLHRPGLLAARFLRGSVRQGCGRHRREHRQAGGAKSLQGKVQPAVHAHRRPRQEGRRGFRCADDHGLRQAPGLPDQGRQDCLGRLQRFHARAGGGGAYGPRRAFGLSGGAPQPRLSNVFMRSMAGFGDPALQFVITCAGED